MWEPRRLTTLWASTACYRDSFTFFFYKKPEIVFSVRGIIAPNKQNRVPFPIIRSYPTIHRPIENTGSNNNHTKWRTYTIWILIQKWDWIVNEKRSLLRNAVEHSVASLTLMELSPSWEAANCAATQELPSILWNSKIHDRVHKRPLLVHNLSQIIPVHTT
jgi:hypothetical protein